MRGIDECLELAAAIPGARGASLVDYTSGPALGTVGEGPGGDHEEAAASATEVARAVLDASVFGSLDDGNPVEDIVITGSGRYHLFRFIETVFDSRVLLYLWLDRTEGNLAMARLRLRSLTDELAGS